MIALCILINRLCYCSRRIRRSARQKAPAPATTAASTQLAQTTIIPPLKAFNREVSPLYHLNPGFYDKKSRILNEPMTPKSYGLSSPSGDGQKLASAEDPFSSTRGYGARETMLTPSRKPHILPEEPNHDISVGIFCVPLPLDSD
jgi:hypothetical protein